MVREVNQKDKSAYDKLATHVIQSWEWGEFREKMGIDLVRLGEFDGNKLTSAYQLTFHPVPFFKNITIGYLPKGPIPTKTMVKALIDLGARKRTAFIKIEPNIIYDRKTTNDERLTLLGLIRSAKWLFTKYNFLIVIS